MHLIVQLEPEREVLDVYKRQSVNLDRNIHASRVTKAAMPSLTESVMARSMNIVIKSDFATANFVFANSASLSSMLPLTMYGGLATTTA